jgi:hypothetical protein
LSFVSFMKFRWQYACRKIIKGYLTTLTGK